MAVDPTVCITSAGTTPSQRRQGATSVPAHEQTAVQRQIDATDRQIDQLVYQLYVLTDEEIKIVEEATR